MRNAVLIFILWLVVMGCGDETPPDLIPEETYIHLMVELQLLQSYATIEQPDSTTIDSLEGNIFRYYDVTEAQFEESHQFYQNNDVRAQRDRIGKAVEALRKDRITGQDSAAAREDSL